jgi:predicted RNA-binding protein YlqC (UPF0109 family)
MIDYALSIIRPLVDHPNEVQITSIDGEKTLVLELHCHDSDVGKVIGKSGKTITSVRSLLSALAARQGRRALIEVVE